MIVTSVQIKTAKTQKHLYCPVFTITNDSYESLVIFILGSFGMLILSKLPLLSSRESLQ